MFLDSKQLQFSIFAIATTVLLVDLETGLRPRCQSCHGGFQKFSGIGDFIYLFLVVGGGGGGGFGLIHIIFVFL